MPKLIRTRPASPAPWPFWVAGAALGALASWALLNRRIPPAVPGAVPPGRPSLRGAFARPPVAPDLAAIAARLRARPGADGLRVQSLGGGILELVGIAPDGLDLEGVLESLATEPGVTVVVNRAWSPRSTHA